MVYRNHEKFRKSKEEYHGIFHQSNIRMKVLIDVFSDGSKAKEEIGAEFISQREDGKYRLPNNTNIYEY